MGPRAGHQLLESPTFSSSHFFLTLWRETRTNGKEEIVFGRKKRGEKKKGGDTDPGRRILSTLIFPISTSLNDSCGRTRVKKKKQGGWGKGGGKKKGEVKRVVY